MYLLNPWRVYDPPPNYQPPQEAAPERLPADTAPRPCPQFDQATETDLISDTLDGQELVNQLYWCLGVYHGGPAGKTNQTSHHRSLT